MTKILFVCHGNICRSTMAEFVFRNMVQKSEISGEVYIASAATSTEEIGNPPHPGTRAKLAEVGISCAGKYAVQMTKSDYTAYDLLIGMDTANIRNMTRISGGDPEGKIHLLLDFAAGGAIADPWYTGDFDATYRDVFSGCKGLLEHIQKNSK